MKNVLFESVELCRILCYIVNSVLDEINYIEAFLHFGWLVKIGEVVEAFRVVYELAVYNDHNLL